MTENVKANLNFANGIAQVEGPDAFVLNCISKFPQLVGHSASEFLVDQSIDHAWDWFALHANQRMQAVNFFLVATAFLTAAYVSAVQYAHPIVACGVAALGGWFCVIFYAFELRIRELIKVGEKALARSQGKLAEMTGIEELRICDRVEKPRFRLTSYHKVIGGLYIITCVAFLVGLVYAVLSAAPWISQTDPCRDLVNSVLYRALAVLGAFLSLYWAQRLAMPTQTTIHWSRYTIAIMLAVGGVSVLVLSIIKAVK